MNFVMEKLVQLNWQHNKWNHIKFSNIYIEVQEILLNLHFRENG